MILGAPLLDFSCLFPKPIITKSVLAIGAHLFGINYPKSNIINVFLIQKLQSNSH